MPNDNTFSLPGTGYDVLQKTIQAYHLARGDGPLFSTDIASRVGLNRTQVSANNQFLVDIGVIEGGRKKQITPEGENLAMAVANNPGQEEEANAWQEIFLGTQTTRELLEMVKVQSEIAKGDMAGRIASSLGVMVNEGSNETRINRLVDLLERADLIEKEGENYRLAPHALDGAHETSVRAPGMADDGIPEESGQGNGSTASEQPETRETVKERVHIENPSLSVAVQIYVDADASPEQIDQVFASMAKHIYNREGEE